MNDPNENDEMNDRMRRALGRQPADPKDQGEAKDEKPKDRKDETPSEHMNRLLRKGNE